MMNYHSCCIFLPRAPNRKPSYLRYIHWLALNESFGNMKHGKVLTIYINEKTKLVDFFNSCDTWSF